MKNLLIDLETYSGVDLSKAGVYRYSESPDFKILLFGYSVDGGAVEVADLANGDTIPSIIFNALTDATVTKWAYNASFERICLSRYLGLPLNTFLNSDQWRCLMVWAACLGLPLALADAGAVLGLEKQKLLEGKALIRQFCQPHNKEQSEQITFSAELPHADWQRFIDYNVRDVEAELAVYQRIQRYPLPEFIWDEYHLDQQINDRGVLVDTTLMYNAIYAEAVSREKVTALMKDATSIENPNSVQQMKAWLSDNGLQTDTLGKKAVSALLQTAPEPLGEMLRLRDQLAKSSVKKYQAMANAVCADNRIRGVFQFYGAGRTGRWSGRLVQLQNLKRNDMPELDYARQLLRAGDYGIIEKTFGSVPEVLSELVRTAFVPPPGKRFIVADFSSIEAVVLAWLAGEQWVLDAYQAGIDLYIRNAERMFNVPSGSIDKHSPLRQSSKIATLACGYGGSVGAMKAFGAVEKGIPEDKLMETVIAWRKANPNIVRLWHAVEDAALTAVRSKTTTNTHNITFAYRSGVLFVTLPSSRSLAYCKPRIGMNRFGKNCLTFEGVGFGKKWERLETFGARLVENICQAIARDLLANALYNLRDHTIVMHVHDEIVLEADPHLTVEAVCEQMCRLPDWAEGLVLKADGFTCDYYKKI